jgi:hypothetical protein
MKLLQPILQLYKRRRVQQFRHRYRTPYNVAAAQKHAGPTDPGEAVEQWVKRDGWALVGILLMLALVGWYFGFYRSTFVVDQVTVEGTQFIPQEQVQATVNDYMAGKRVWLIQQNKYWTVVPGDIEERIRTQFEQQYAIEEVTVTKQLPDKLTVTIKERIPSVTWMTVENGLENYYTVDRNGIVTQWVPSKDQVNTSYPLVKDKNRNHIDVGWHIISAQYIETVLQIHEMVPEYSPFPVLSYEFPHMACQKREDVAEKIFQHELDESISEEFKDKKRDIQERFQSGELTIDESIEELEKIKQEEFEQSQGEEEGSGAIERIQWETKFVETDCDFVTVATDVHVLLKASENKAVPVYMDTTVDPAIQLHNVQVVLQSKITDLTEVEYIDVRIPDRAYYQ